MKYKGLADMARNAPLNKQFVHNFRTSARSVVKKQQDLLLDTSSTDKQRLDALADLVDLRTAVDHLITSGESAQTKNFEALVAKAEAAAGETTSCNLPDLGNARLEVSEPAFLTDGKSGYPIASEELKGKFVKDNAVGFDGLKSFRTLTDRAIGLAASLVAVPSGPLAASIANISEQLEDAMQNDNPFSEETPVDQLYCTADWMTIKAKQAEFKPAESNFGVATQRQEIYYHPDYLPGIANTPMDSRMGDLEYTDVQMPLAPDRLWLPE